MKENDLYEPPKVEVIEVEVEGGFAVSGQGFDSITAAPWENMNGGELETD